MTRVRLGGQGDPIPSIALPDPNLDEGFPPVTLLFTENGVFSQLDYANLGYTNYEVFCIGAAGGRGGDAASQFDWDVTFEDKPVPTSVWNLVRERASLGDYLQQASLYNNPNTGDKRHNYTVAPAMNKVYQPWLYPVFTPGTNCWLTDVRDETVHPTYMRWHAIMQEFGHIDNLTVSGPNNTPATPYWSPNPMFPAGGYWWGFTQWAFWQGTYLDMFELHHSAHKLTFVTFQDVNLITQAGFIENIGGAGGGGGMHRISGFLSDLPAEVPIVVGQLGADAPVGQMQQSGVLTPTPPVPGSFDWFSIPDGQSLFPPYVDTAPMYVGYGTPQGNRVEEIEAYLNNYLSSYPLPHKSFPNPQAGGDGGASSFDGTLARASGAKGGGPSMGWPGGVKTYLGFGSEGGAGDRITAGGGAAGSTASGVAGSEGTWDGTIGKGGGGGLSGKASAPTRVAGSGGRGSYSFSDPSVHGPRQSKSGNKPGSGGGAKLNPSAIYGSHALGSNPNGVVYIRLTKVDP